MSFLNQQPVQSETGSVIATLSPFLQEPTPGEKNKPLRDMLAKNMMQ